jgi:hypothetical protein
VFMPADGTSAASSPHTGISALPWWQLKTTLQQYRTHLKSPFAQCPVRTKWITTSKLCAGPSLTAQKSWSKKSALMILNECHALLGRIAAPCRRVTTSGLVLQRGEKTILDKISYLRQFGAIYRERRMCVKALARTGSAAYVVVLGAENYEKARPSTVLSPSKPVMRAAQSVKQTP